MSDTASETDSTVSIEKDKLTHPDLETKNMYSMYLHNNKYYLGKYIYVSGPNKTPFVFECPNAKLLGMKKFNDLNKRIHNFFYLEGNLRSIAGRNNLDTMLQVADIKIHEKVSKLARYLLNTKFKIFEEDTDKCDDNNSQELSDILNIERNEYINYIENLKKKLKGEQVVEESSVKASKEPKTVYSIPANKSNEVSKPPSRPGAKYSIIAPLFGHNVNVKDTKGVYGGKKSKKQRNRKNKTKKAKRSKSRKLRK
jgi:hypothetical protein